MLRRSHGSLSDYIKEMRLQAGLSQGALAEKLGYSTAQFISNWERHVANPPIAALKGMIPILKLDRELVIELYLKGTAEFVRTALKRGRGKESKRGSDKI